MPRKSIQTTWNNLPASVHHRSMMPGVNPGLPVPALLAYDTFNRADSPTLGSDQLGNPWEIITDPRLTPGHFGILGNKAYQVTQQFLNVAVVNLATENASGDGIEVFATLTGDTGNGLIVGFAEGFDYPTFFVFQILDLGLDSIQYHLYSNGGNYVFQAGDVTDNLVDGLYSLSLEAGGVCTLKKDGVVQGTITDADVPAGTRCGIFGQQTTGGPDLDPFRVENFSVKRLSDDVVLSSDNFNRANNSLTLGTDAQGHTWESFGVPPGVLGIVSNKVTFVGTYGNVVEVVDAGHPGQAVEINATLDGYGGIVAGLSDWYNYFFFETFQFNDGSLNILGWQAGDASNPSGNQHDGFTGAYPLGAVTLVLDGHTAIISQDGVELDRITGPDVVKGSKHGIYGLIGTTENYSLDDFKVLEVLETDT